MMSLSDNFFNLTDLQERALEYWTAAKGLSPLPSRRDYDFLEISTVMPFAVIFDVLSQPLDFRYRLVGTAVTENTFADYTGRTLGQMEGKGPGSKIWTCLDSVRVEMHPKFMEVPYVGPKEDLLRTTLLMLPLSDDGCDVNMIFIASAFHRTQ